MGADLGGRRRSRPPRQRDRQDDQRERVPVPGEQIRRGGEEQRVPGNRGHRQNCVGEPGVPRPPPRGSTAQRTVAEHQQCRDQPDQLGRRGHRAESRRGETDQDERGHLVPCEDRGPGPDQPHGQQQHSQREPDQDRRRREAVEPCEYSGQCLVPGGVEGFGPVQLPEGVAEPGDRLARGEQQPGERRRGARGERGQRGPAPVQHEQAGEEEHRRDGEGGGQPDAHPGPGSVEPALVEPVAQRNDLIGGQPERPPRRDRAVLDGPARGGWPVQGAAQGDQVGHDQPEQQQLGAPFAQRGPDRLGEQGECGGDEGERGAPAAVPAGDGGGQRGRGEEQRGRPGEGEEPAGRFQRQQAEGREEDGECGRQRGAGLGEGCAVRVQLRPAQPLPHGRVGDGERAEAVPRKGYRNQRKGDQATGGDQRGPVSSSAKRAFLDDRHGSTPVSSSGHGTARHQHGFGGRWLPGGTS